MPVTNYYTIDGQLIGYKDQGGRKDFLTDALGSVTAEVDQTGITKTFDGRYKPYGGDLSSTGTRENYGWVGSWGYRGTGLTSSSHYVRARHYSKISGNWTTIDILWPEEMAYGYAGCNPLLLFDPTGEAACSLIKDCRGECIKAEADKIWGSVTNDKCRLEFLKCQKDGVNILLCVELRKKCREELIGYCINKCLTFDYNFGPLCVKAADKHLDDALAVCAKTHKDCLRNKKTRKARSKCDSEYQLCIHRAGIIYNLEFRRCLNKQ